MVRDRTEAVNGSGVAGILAAEHSAVGPATATGPAAADNGYADHYAKTLSPWRERSAANRSTTRGLRLRLGLLGLGFGFDPLFQRMREFCLASSEAGFRSRHLDIRQLLLTEGTHR